MQEVLGFSELEWVAINVISVVVGTFVVILTAFFGFRQLRQTTRSSQFTAVNKLQELVDAFREDRSLLFNTIPLQLAVKEEQFAAKPPTRTKLQSQSEGERRGKILSGDQLALLESLTEEQESLLRRVIVRLNDIGELVEDGFVPRQVFFGKYHVMIIQCCSMVEAMRQKIEERQGGGNFGHRLLRIRRRATMYNDIIPKHRDVKIYVHNKNMERELVYCSPKASVLKQVAHLFRKIFSLY